MLAAERPCLFFPSMNASMWAKKTTQRHVAVLRADGHTIAEPWEQQTYVMWRREFAPSPAMPPPAEATEIVVRWLEDSLSDEVAGLEAAPSGQAP